MSSQIEVARVTQFGANILMLAQQKGSRLRNTVMFEPGIRGKKFSRDQVGPTEMTQRTTRNGDTQVNDVPHYRRWLMTSTFNWATLVDNIDKLKVIEDPTNAYAMQAAAAAGRRIDKTIIDAFFATAVTGEEAGSTVAFTAGNTIAVNSWAYGQGSGNAGLTVSKLIQARQILRAGETGIEDEEAYICVTSKQEANLLATTEATSADYGKPTLVDGKISKFMGFTFIHSEQLGVDASSYRRCPAWIKSGMCLGMVEDINTKITERADKNYATQIWNEIDLGATRMEETKVVEILCNEA